MRSYSICSLHSRRGNISLRKGYVVEITEDLSQSMRNSFVAYGTFRHDRGKIRGRQALGRFADNFPL